MENATSRTRSPTERMGKTLEATRPENNFPTLAMENLPPAHGVLLQSSDADPRSPRDSLFSQQSIQFDSIVIPKADTVSLVSEGNSSRRVWRWSGLNRLGLTSRKSESSIFRRPRTVASSGLDDAHRENRSLDDSFLPPSIYTLPETPAHHHEATHAGITNQGTEDRKSVV